MSFRSRLLLASLILALAPLVFFGLRVRGEVAAQLEARHEERVAALASVIAEDLVRESAAVAARLDRLAEAMATDDRLRAVLLGVGRGGGDGAGRGYLLDYASGAMPLAGLDLLRIQDEEGRVLSSGHFRHEYDAVDRSLVGALRDTGHTGVLAAFPTPAGPTVGLARARTLQVGPRTLTLVGGSVVDQPFLTRLARGSGLEVRLRLPGDAVHAAADSGSAHDVVLRFADASGAPDGGREETARFVVHASNEPLIALLRRMDRWLLVTLGAAGALAFLLALTVSGRLSRPLAVLASKAERVDLGGPNVDFATSRKDEVGTLSRVLDRMTVRLRGSAARLREAERRAAVGELARQVNHDLRNGLVPIRNVMRHLAEIARERPEELSGVFLERRGTVDSSLAYLDSLAVRYATLSPKPILRPCDLNAIVGEVAGTVGGADTELDPRLPPVRGDPVALRRILENLVVNALESLDGQAGSVTVWTRRDPEDSVSFGVIDEGRGMTEEERARAFDHFYTTKPEGSGLGLSIVRRLVSDLGGRIEVESQPGVGTRVTVALSADSDAPQDAWKGGSA